VTFEQVHEWILPYLPAKPSLILDIGAGSGRDAAALAERGYEVEVVAVEPSANMLMQARIRHPHLRIRWVSDRLPGLSSLFRSGLSFDFILASAIWMHLAPEVRKRAMRKVVDLLKPGGHLAVTPRKGPAPTEQRFYNVNPDETVQSAEDQGVRLIYRQRAQDLLGRQDVFWTHLIFRLGDNGTEALPILRHAILHSDKSSTYKLGLLRAIVRLAGQSPGLARQTSDDSVSVPLGQIGLNWIRIYAPLLAGNLPQTPLNTDREKGLGFSGEPWRRVFSEADSPLFISPGELRAGAVFRGEGALLLHRALKDAIANISKNPSHYLTFPRTDQPVFIVRKNRIASPEAALSINTEYLWSFGTLEIPFSIWKAMTRYAVWIEPALLDEWARLTRNYAERQDRTVNENRMKQAFTWGTGSGMFGQHGKMRKNSLQKDVFFAFGPGNDCIMTNGTSTTVSRGRHGPATTSGTFFPPATGSTFRKATGSLLHKRSLLPRKGSWNGGTPISREMEKHVKTVSTRRPKIRWGSNRTRRRSIASFRGWDSGALPFCPIRGWRNGVPQHRPHPPVHRFRRPESSPFFHFCSR
jgi:SAM-dependent methyltransferase